MADPASLANPYGAQYHLSSTGSQESQQPQVGHSQGRTVEDCTANTEKPVAGHVQEILQGEMQEVISKEFIQGFFERGSSDVVFKTKVMDLFGDHTVISKSIFIDSLRKFAWEGNSVAAHMIAGLYNQDNSQVALRLQYEAYLLAARDLMNTAVLNDFGHFLFNEWINYSSVIKNDGDRRQVLEKAYQVLCIAAGRGESLAQGNAHSLTECQAWKDLVESGDKGGLIKAANIDMEKASGVLQSWISSEIEKLKITIPDCRQALSVEHVIERAITEESYFHLLLIWCEQQLPAMRRQMEKAIMDWVNGVGKEKQGAFKELVHALSLQESDPGKAKSLSQQVIDKGETDGWPYWAAYERMIRTTLQLSPDKGKEMLESAKNLADAGNSYAAYCCGIVYLLSGGVVSQDQNAAVSIGMSYLTQAADAGLGFAKRLKGHILRSNESIGDPNKKVRDDIIYSNLEDVVLADYPVAYCDLAEVSSVDSFAVFRLNAKAALMGHPKAQSNVGYLLVKNYEKYGFGKEDAIKAAQKWLSLASSTGYHLAKHQLGNLYLKHYGVLGVPEGIARIQGERLIAECNKAAGSSDEKSVTQIMAMLPGGTLVKLAPGAKGRQVTREIRKASKKDQQKLEEQKRNKKYQKQLERIKAKEEEEAAKKAAKNRKKKEKRKEKAKEQQSKPEVKEKSHAGEEKQKEKEIKKEKKGSAGSSSSSGSDEEEKKEKEFLEGLKERAPGIFNELSAFNEYDRTSLKRNSRRSITGGTKRTSVAEESKRKSMTAGNHHASLNRTESGYHLRQAARQNPKTEKADLFKGKIQDKKVVADPEMERVSGDQNTLISEWPTITSKHLKFKALEGDLKGVYQIYVGKDASHRILFIEPMLGQIVWINLYRKTTDEMPAAIREETVREVAEYRAKYSK